MTNRRGRMSLCLPLVALLAFGGACSSPTAPPAPTAIAIAPAPGVLKIGQSETLRAVASPEVSGALTVTWTSDNPAVATVDARGQVAGVAAGTATIRATSRSSFATLTLIVVPDYAGTWIG